VVSFALYCSFLTLKPHINFLKKKNKKKENDTSDGVGNGDKVFRKIIALYLKHRSNKKQTAAKIFLKPFRA
jgi:hypothetical protein